MKLNIYLRNINIYNKRLLWFKSMRSNIQCFPQLGYTSDQVNSNIVKLATHIVRQWPGIEINSLFYSILRYGQFVTFS